MSKNIVKRDPNAIPYAVTTVAGYGGDSVVDSVRDVD